MGEQARQHFLVGGTLFAQPDIFHDGIIEKHHVLEYFGMISQQGFRIYTSDVNPANFTAVLFPEPEAPTNAVTWPSFAVKLTPLRMRQAS